MDFLSDSNTVVCIATIAAATSSIIALIISMIALVYTTKTYLLKAGTRIRGSFSPCSSQACEDQYVSTVTLENMKDKAEIIYKIFMRLGHNYYVVIEDFEDNPLILKPFEAWTKQYDPIEYYSVNMNRIKLNNLFSDRKVKTDLVLSTAQGKYIVKPRDRYWDPIVDFFKNHMTAIIHPIRGTYKEKAYGSNAKYIVDISLKGGKEEVIAIYPRDYEIKKFRKFSLTQDSLNSKESLEEYLYEKVGEGVLNCTEIKVHDLESWRKESYEMDSKKIIEAKHDGYLFYHVVGRVLTILSDFRMKIQNKRRRKELIKKSSRCSKLRG